MENLKSEIKMADVKTVVVYFRKYNIIQVRLKGAGKPFYVICEFRDSKADILLGTINIYMFGVGIITSIYDAELIITDAEEF